MHTLLDNENNGKVQPLSHNMKVNKILSGKLIRESLVSKKFIKIVSHEHKVLHCTERGPNYFSVCVFLSVSLKFSYMFYLCEIDSVSGPQLPLTTLIMPTFFYYTFIF